MKGNKALLIAGVRTPIGSFGRSLSEHTVDQLAEHSVRHAINRSGLTAGQFDGFILGHAFQSGFTPNTARFVWNNANLPASTWAYTVQDQCGSGMKAVNLAMDEIALGHGDLYLAGGAESMSTVPYMVHGQMRFKSWLAKKLPKFFPKIGPRLMLGGLAQDGMAPLNLIKDTRTVAMAQTAQRLADNYGISREDMDAYALRSQDLAAKAVKSGRFATEIAAVLTKRGPFTTDENPRSSSAEGLKGLKPVLKTRDITAGNASGINDGACVLALASEAKVAELGVKPMAVLVDHVLVGLDPEQMGLGPVFAIRKLLARNGLTVNDIGYFELNEAFAAQYLACEKLLGLDRNKVNLNGGAIALGHPIAMSGARVILTAAIQMQLLGVKYAVASLCVGGGMGIATLLQLPS
ncbi:MAG: thiolase family protein [Candidatus Obscuribacterales bacterium]|nr:thiolase family protein [Candidatus Obscuribacterales bacterium]